MSDRFILTGGMICDGTGQDAFQGELLVENGVIQQVQRGITAPKDSTPRIDCHGLVVAPGFIDINSNMDFYAGFGGAVYFEGFTRQGVTSFVTGQGGYSPFPIAANSSHQPLLNQPPFDIGQIEQPAGGLRQFQHYLSPDIHHQLIPLAGHGSCRLSIAGYDNRPLNGKERQQLLGLLEESLQDGAAGLSIGLGERPGMFATKEELLAVAQLAQRYDRLLRVTGRTQMALSGYYPPVSLRRHNLKAIDEMVMLARQTGVKLQCSHLAFLGGRSWYTFDTALDSIHQACELGVDIQFDISPHSVATTSLINLLPQWFVGNWQQMMESSVQRYRLKLALAMNFSMSGFSFNDIRLVSAVSDQYEQYEGERLDTIANATRQNHFNTLLDILSKSHGQARVMVYKRYGAGMVQQLMEHTCSLLGSGAVPEPLSGVHNPSAAAAFPRFLQIARNTGALSMEHCVRKMTGGVADRAGVRDRGYLLEGKRADITVFNWMSLMDLTDFAGYNAQPDGIEQVYIGGKCLLRNSQLVSAKSVSSSV
ncbi:amidohydrolase family protein [Endozoicomonas gorgoniicola]|uniref:Amidohydrolase family protein n=1 Tax=Endozoicomonas gorgoniicola TaxID=1234144 RepID=A0ABT3MYB7_9GAMM|nr:amidohydrolase family protein [Endozoicomonas gorgoniicola]MCW7554376.1 amidohydrolase family protein [Endozoicomonas gorgoniicola]